MWIQWFVLMYSPWALRIAGNTSVLVMTRDGFRISALVLLTYFFVCLWMLPTNEGNSSVKGPKMLSSFSLGFKSVTLYLTENVLQNLTEKMFRPLLSIQ